MGWRHCQWSRPTQSTAAGASTVETVWEPSSWGTGVNHRSWVRAELHGQGPTEIGRQNDTAWTPQDGWDQRPQKREAASEGRTVTGGSAG